MDILDLVERYRRNREAYTSGQYNETQLRREYLDPFFTLLGWDMDNKQGYAEAYKDVVHEDAIKIGGFTKAPDYSFRIGGARKFFVEAKKPAIHIKDDIDPAFQLRRYAWSAKLPISILTSFEEFAVYDCRIKPVKTDKASTARILYMKFDEYETKWDYLSSILSKESVLQGAFDKYTDSGRTKKGTAEVDTAFLKEIESWRELLARNLALRNPELTQRELNFVVQATIDRIVFLRICEDRGIEDYSRLMGLLSGPDAYRRLCQFFRRADEKYNSGLFHFRGEKDRPEPPDDLSLNVLIDDKVLKEIIRNLYYPDSPYEFSVLPADILGHVYEQFLGKVIHLSAGHRATIEDKPEVKKAGGVFYTPRYIVDYIVQNTVGKLLEGKSPKQAENLKILDPACGSGSFLIGAYQYLLDWHHDWYIQHMPEKWAIGKKPALYKAAGNEWRLTTSERKRILLNNIHGVDIDAQAVEVTKLSLLLKVLEGETEQSIKQGILVYHERALPDLAGNIKCGNSLIGPDFYEGRLTGVFDDEECLRVNVFDWKKEFPNIMKAGGFDAVIGNPPYIRIQTLKEWAPLEIEFYKRRYLSAGSGNYDIYVVFVEKGLQLINEKGRLGFILPSKFFTTDYGEALRDLITKKKALAEIVDFAHMQVFGTATTYTCLLFLTGSYSDLVLYKKVFSSVTLVTQSDRTMNGNIFNKNPWSFRTEAENNIVDKMFQGSIQLINLPALIGRGSSSGDDDIFVLKKLADKFATQHDEQIDIEEEILRIPVYATDFGRYTFSPKAEEAIIFPYVVSEKGYELMSEALLQTQYPKAYKYLSGCKKRLQLRKQFKEWYGFSAPRNLHVHDVAHMFVPLLADKGSYCRLSANTKRFCLMASGGFSITVASASGFSPNYVLGLLNSKLLFWRLESISNVFRGGWITCTKQYVETLPIRAIDFSNRTDVACYDLIVSHVEQMLTLHVQHTAAKTGHEKTAIERQIDAIDRQIDMLVYELYGLTEEEISLIESTR